MDKYNYIGDGKPHKLLELFVSSDIDNETVISVYDGSGQMIARGLWFEDHMLELDKLYGTATGDRERIDFRLIKEATA